MQRMGIFVLFLWTQKHPGVENKVTYEAASGNRYSGDCFWYYVRVFYKNPAWLDFVVTVYLTNNPHLINVHIVYSSLMLEVNQQILII
jgi:hypothetical protein